MSDMFDKRGVVEILGLYGHSAYHYPPQPEVSFDVNQIPEIFFDYLPKVDGPIVFGVEIDGNELKDCQSDGTNVSVVTEDNEVKRRAFPMWIPQKYRIVARHVITVKTGHVETYRDFFLRLRERVAWDTRKDFGLTFTGTKSRD